VSEAPVRSIEAHLRAAVESAPSGLLMTDNEGRIVLVNREIERMFGYAREELLGQPVERLVPTRSQHAHPGYRGGFHGDPRVRAMGAGRDLFGLRKDGTEVPVEIGLTPLATAEGMFVLGAVVDISERKRLEEEQRALSERLRQSQKMEAIGTLAGGIAHDFNNLLGAIIGYTELIAARVANDVALTRDVGEVMSAAMRGRHLVDRILRFSRRQDTAHNPIDLREVVHEVQHLLRATLPAGVALTVKVSPDVPKVLADATSVHQVLMNLASNGAQAMPRGGSLLFEVEPLYVHDSIARANPNLHEGHYVAMSVRDAGEGMPPETRARAFEPFFTTKSQVGGTGLGLAMVHGIMQDHSGAVMLESEVGVGTRVRCLFPAIEQEEIRSVAVEASGPALRGNGECVLYVDDEPSLLEAGRRRLESLGYQPITAANGAIALEFLRASPRKFDLVVTDLSMPGISGLELAEAIQTVRSDLPVVLLSGYIRDAADPMLRSVGISKVLQKPALQEEFARACREALATTRRRST
jgi:PAS domain S-box-containing protein